MKKLLVIVDMQNDFIDGALGSKEAEKIVPKVVNKISNWDKEDDIIFTLDTHYDNYLKTKEGSKLPVEHCIFGTNGWMINSEIAESASGRANVFQCMKPTFGSTKLSQYLLEKQYDYIEFVGLCTDICVISNVMLAKANLPEATIIVDASCCAGVTPESHNNALSAMKCCHIDIINEQE